MTRRIGFAVLLAVFVLSTGSLTAQDSKTYPTWLFGPYIGLDLNFHSSDFLTPLPTSLTDFPGLPSTNPLDDSDLGLGLNGGLLLEYRMNETFGFGGRLGFGQANGDLLGADTLTDGSLTELTMESSLMYLDITPLANFYDIFGVENLYALGGLNIGVPLSNSYTLTETAQGDGQFSDGNNERSYGTDVDIPDAALRLALTAGIGYNIPLTETMYLSPEAQIRFPLSDVSSNDLFDSWNVPQARLGIALKFDLSSDEAETPEPDGDSGLRAGMDEIVYYDETGASQPLDMVRVEDLQYSEMYPLLPYIFFDEGKSTPSAAMQVSEARSDAGEFSIAGLPQDAMEINRNALNVIGARMLEYPNARLTITGTTDGKESAQVAKARADWAKKYLVDNFGIDANRITAEGRALPAKPSNVKDADGIAENRRIEFTSTMNEVLAPLTVQQDNQRIATPHLIEFRPSATSKAELTQWTLTVSQAGKILREFTYNGAPKARRWIIRPNELSASKLPIEWNLSVADASGAISEVNGQIQVDYLSSSRKATEQLPDRTIEKFSLILFDFDSADMTESNRDILTRAIVPSIRHNSQVRVYGYADRIGPEKYNKDLSQRRAETVKVAIDKATKSGGVEASGVGEDLLLFDNDSPIGRNLCRTVQVIVETPK